MGTPIRLVVLSLIVVAGCARPDPAPPPEDVADASVTPVVEAAPVRVTSDEASRIVRTTVFEMQPSMNPEYQVALREITTDDVWERLRVQVFQITEGPPSYRTYVVRDGRAEQIGEGFGGYGVVSMCAADLNGDGADELVYSFSWGSGIHRSRLAYADLRQPALVQHVAEAACFRMEDMMVRPAADGSVVEVYLEERLLGTLVGAPRAEPPLRLDFAEGVDPEILSRGW
jgi:hypothetical protein